MSKLKKCRTCDESKPRSSYHKDKSLKDGLRVHCKDCINRKNREKYANDKEYRDRVDRRNKRWAKNNREKSNKIKQRYIKNNPKRRQISYTLYNNKRRVAEEEGDVTFNQIAKLYEKEKNCFWCGVEVYIGFRHLDHIMPLDLDGRHTVKNLCVSCPDCNLKKNSTHPVDWVFKIFTGEVELAL